MRKLRPRRKDRFAFVIVTELCSVNAHFWTKVGVCVCVCPRWGKGNWVEFGFRFPNTTPFFSPSCFLSLTLSLFCLVFNSHCLHFFYAQSYVVFEGKGDWGLAECSVNPSLYTFNHFVMPWSLQTPWWTPAISSQNHCCLWRGTVQGSDNYTEF